MFCSKCGKDIMEGKFICESCGKIIKRPKSINTAAIIYIIEAIITVFVGVIFIWLPSFSKITAQSPRTPSEAFTRQYGLLIGVAILLWGIIDFVVWFGLRRLKKWAGILGIIECSAAIMLSVFLPQLRDIVNYLLNLLVIMLIYYGRNSLS